MITPQTLRLPNLSAHEALSLTLNRGQASHVQPLSVVPRLIPLCRVVTRVIVEHSRPQSAYQHRGTIILFFELQQSSPAGVARMKVGYLTVEHLHAVG